jgi:hypothetical protein
MFLPISHALMGHGVFSALLSRPTGRLGASGAGLLCWGGGIRCIVSHGEKFSPRDGAVALLSGFLGCACAGVPGEAFPAFIGWLSGWWWLWVEL